MAKETGSISIHSENMMPIIKKWLYSDRDIFVRELISNGTDAITKHKKLADMGEAPFEPGEYSLTVHIDEPNGTLAFCDNGLGMTANEVKQYINQVAFSGAEEFIKKYENSGGEGIIGHFGLGFYSAFMVAQTVQIDSLSYQQDVQAVRWRSDGGTSFALEEGDKADRGTNITLFIGEEGKEFLDYQTVRTTIEKYCAFLPVPIYLYSVSKEQESAKRKAEHEVKVAAAANDEEREKIPPYYESYAPQTPLNDTHPLWIKNPSEITDDEYKAFYRDVFKTWDEPLFWIHLNVDYPFHVKGILYFPQLSKQMDNLEGQIKLYNNQVFVADNIKEVIPEFLMLLRGVIDCPDLPLNVSRSFLQNDGTVRKMQQHISKKVADKLKALFENEREQYEKYWKDINPFIKYGVLKDDKFYEQVEGALLFERLDGSMWTLSDAREYAKNHGGRLYYVNDRDAQAFYMDLFRKQEQEAVILDAMIDNHFISFLENKAEGLSFGRIDSEVAQAIQGQYEDLPDAAALESIMRKATGQEELNVEVTPLKSVELPAMLVVDESMRRFAEMSARMGGNFPPMEAKEKLVLNGSSNIVKKLASADGDDAQLVAACVYDLALLARGGMDAEQSKAFIERSSKILEKLSEFLPGSQDSEAK